MQGYFDTKEFEQLLASYEEAQQRGESIYLDSEQMTDIVIIMTAAMSKAIVFFMVIPFLSVL